MGKGSEYDPYVKVLHHPNQREGSNMPMHWRRVVDISAFLIAIGVAVWVRYVLDSAWWVAIAVGLLVFVVTPFIMIKRMERGH
jgi:Flp pilus assembly protein TadB